MNSSAHLTPDDPILIDRAASYFWSAGLARRAKLRASGTLVLTEDRLTFEPAETGASVEIPVSDIRSLGMGGWQEALGTYVPLLKIIYRENLLFAVQVERPQGWIEAIEGLASHRRKALSVQASPAEVWLSRRLRLLLVGFLVLVLVLGTLPQFLARLGAVRNGRGPSPILPAQTSP